MIRLSGENVKKKRSDELEIDLMFLSLLQRFF